MKFIIGLFIGAFIMILLKGGNSDDWYMKLTNHSKVRMRERTTLNRKEQKMLFRRALDNGLSVSDIKDKQIKQFLSERTRNCKVKLYRGYVFIYSKNSCVFI